MIFIRLIYCAIILLVLLLVGSAMGGSEEPYKFYASQAESGVCLSLRERQKLAACCNKNDDRQMIQITKTGVSEGIFHTAKGDRLLCYNIERDKFIVVNRNSLKGLKNCRRHRKSCPFTSSDKENIKNISRPFQCILHEKMSHSGFFYISAEKNAKYLGVRNGKVQKHKKRGKFRETKEKYRSFMSIGPDDIERVKCSR